LKKCNNISIRYIRTYSVRSSVIIFRFSDPLFLIFQQPLYFYWYDTMNQRILHLLFLAVVLGFLFPFSAISQSGDTGESEISTAKIVLVQAVMCEDLQERIPQNPTTVFSIERRKAICFTSFDPVPEKTIIYHQWFHRDQTSAKMQLTLKPPRWSTYSSIQLRAEDIGPWRVEISDSQGHILDALRFSITE